LAYVPASAYELGLEPFQVNGNGNCFFNAISVIMTEEETDSTIYRLGAVIYGCTHFEHLVEKVSVD